MEPVPQNTVRLFSVEAVSFLLMCTAGSTAGQTVVLLFVANEEFERQITQVAIESVKGPLFS